MAVDLMFNGQGQGDVANYVLNSNSKLDPGTMRPYLNFNEKTGEWGTFVTRFKGGDAKNPANYAAQQIQIQTNTTTLRKDEWKYLDDAVLAISETRLSGIKDLVSKGLTYTLGNAMGTTVLEWDDSGDAMEAEMTMDAISRGRNDRVTFQRNSLPIPIIHVDYEINARFLATSRNNGNPIETASAERAARKVADYLESLLFTDTAYAWGELDDRSRNSIYSYINFPDRENLVVTAWTASGKTGIGILNDVLAAKGKLIAAKHYGPYTLYIPSTWELVLDEDYVGSNPDTSTKTMRERILAVSNITDIKVVDTLPVNHAVLVQMTPDVVRLVQGMGIQNVQWQTEGNFINRYKVMTIQVPQIRSDRNGKSGICLIST